MKKYEYNRILNKWVFMFDLKLESIQAWDRSLDALINWSSSIDWLTDCVLHLVIALLIDWIFDWLIWSIDWLVDCLFACLIDWLIHELILINWLTDCLLDLVVAWLPDFRIAEITNLCLQICGNRGKIAEMRNRIPPSDPLAKGTIFVTINLANSTTSNMLAADPYPKFSQKPPRGADKLPDPTL